MYGMIYIFCRLPIYFFYIDYIYRIYVFKEWEIISYVIYSISGMAKGRGQEAEEAADLIVNDEFDIGEMDPANSLDEDWSSDEDPISRSEIESDDHGDFYSGRQVLNRTQGGANIRGWDNRTRGGLVRGIGTTRGLSTGGRTIRSRLERGVVANANAMTFMINSLVNLTVLMQRRKTQ